jgi:carbon monoxide dehydrogenase subunit G
MKIDNRFTVSAPIDRAWAVLTDLEGIAPCLPGAQLTGVDGDVYTGKVKVKVGPVTSEYGGTARFAEKDDAAHRAVINAAGKDTRGAGNASATITAQLRDDGGRTEVVVETDLKITGRIAQFGSGAIKEISAKLLGQFADNLEGKLATETTQPSTQPATPQLSAAAAPQPTQNAAADDVRTPAAVGTPTRAPAPTPEAKPLDLMSVAGATIYKRLIPLVVVIVIVVALIVYFVVR